MVDAVKSSPILKLNRLVRVLCVIRNQIVVKISRKTFLCSVLCVVFLSPSSSTPPGGRCGHCRKKKKKTEKRVCTGSTLSVPHTPLEQCLSGQGNGVVTTHTKSSSGSRRTVERLGSWTQKKQQKKKVCYSSLSGSKQSRDDKGSFVPVRSTPVRVRPDGVGSLRTTIGK